MFTGIIKEIGQVKLAERGNDMVRFEIACPVIRSEIHEGDSIAIDGCDLTATALSPDGFRCDATLETLRRTTLGDLRPGSLINLEPSLTPSTPISGHFVLGHIDGVGTVQNIKRMGDQAEFIVAPPQHLLRFIAEKGSITISGTGLTVSSVASDTVSCWLIPYTLTHTTLGSIRPGGKVNLEVDVLARYVIRAIEMGVKQEGRITEDFLSEHGFG
jgi:riboflavin synthase